MPQTKPVIRVENVVASASVDQPMDLNEITRTFPDVEYHPDEGGGEGGISFPGWCSGSGPRRLPP